MTRSTITLLTCLALVACGSTRSDPTPPDLPQGRSGVIVEIRDEGGFAPIEASLTSIPRFVVFADGTVVRHVPSADRLDGFPLFRSRLTEPDLTDLLTYLDDLGLAEVDRIDVAEAQNVADAPTTVLTMYDENGPHRLGVYALGIDDPTDPRSAILASMISLLERATPDRDDVYEPPAYQILVSANTVDGRPAAQQDWPLEAAPSDIDEHAIGGWRCVVVTPEEIDPRLIEHRGDAPSAVWTYEDAPYLVLAGPLFPHEDGC